VGNKKTSRLSVPESESFLNVLSYIQPVRTFTPSSGVGRHINGMLGELSRRAGVDLSLLFARQWLGADGKLPANAPLRDVPFRSFALPERLVERSWKLTGWPKIDRFLEGADVLYAPADTTFPRTSVASFVTLHDIHPLDPLYPDFEAHASWNSQRRRWQHWVPKTFETSSAILTVSDFCRGRMESLLDTRDKPIHVIGNGVDQCFFDLADRDVATCRKPGSWPYCVVVGGLTSRKGAEATIRTAGELVKIGSDVRIVVIGQSEPQWSAAAENHANIVQLGKLPDDLMGEYLRAAGCLLFLSLYEGFGIPIIEAMAAGVPTVVSNTSSLPEVAGDAGCVFPPEDASEIARTIDAICRGSAEAKRMRQKGIARAKQFTWAACVDRLMVAIGG